MIPIIDRHTPSSNVDFSLLKLKYQEIFLKLLTKFDGTKVIIWDDKLIRPFGLVAGASLLKQYDATRMFRLSNISTKDFNDCRSEYTLIFMRKDYVVAKRVADILRNADRLALSKTSLVMVPNRCASIEKFLEHNKIQLEKLNSIEELNIELYVLDSDVLSTENEYVYRDLYVNEDHSFAHQIVEALVKVQEIYGRIPKISGQGKAAKIVCDLLLQQRKFQSSTLAGQTAATVQAPSQINHLILIDRRIDLTTPLLTQLTYEGVLDEVFGIDCGIVTVPGERFEQQQQPEDCDEHKKKQPPISPVELKQLELRSSEDLYAKLRDCHINAVADVLKQSAKNLQAEYDECANTKDKTIPEMGKIVKRIKHLKEAKKSQLNQSAIAELISEKTLKAEFINGLRIEHELLQEDKLNRIIPEIDTKLLRQEPALHVLRLICLQTILNNGLKSKTCDHYKREIWQNYGDDYLLFMMQLERAQVLLSQEKFHSCGYYSQLKGKFNLIQDNVNEINPNHFSYVYGGYSPLSIVIIKILLQSTQNPNWRLQGDILRLLPEPTVTHSDLTNHQRNQLNLAIQQQSASASSSIIPVPSTSASANTYIEAGYNLTSNALATASLLLSAGFASTTGGSVAMRMRRNSATSSQSSSDDTKTVLVFFIGGCTYAEVSALRFLSQQEENNCEFLIGTTKIINGHTFLKSMWPVRI